MPNLGLQCIEDAQENPSWLKYWLSNFQSACGLHRMRTDRQKGIQAFAAPTAAGSPKGSGLDQLRSDRVSELGSDDLDCAYALAILRAEPKPCRTTLARPSASFSSAVVSRSPRSSISSARASSSWAPFRRISVIGSRPQTADGRRGRPRSPNGSDSWFDHRRKLSLAHEP